MKVAGPSPISLIIIFKEMISLKNRGEDSNKTRNCVCGLKDRNDIVNTYLAELLNN